MLSNEERDALWQIHDYLKHLEEIGAHKGYYHSGWAGAQLRSLLTRSALETSAEYECNNDKCNWKGPLGDLVHPKHMANTLLCPKCYETVVAL